MMHFEFELQEHGILLITLIFGVVFWFTIITIIALVLVVDRLVDEIINGGDDNEDAHATLDEDT